MKRSNQVLATRTIDLGYDQLLVLEGQPGESVKVLFGGMWLTETGRDDVFAGPQEQVVLQSRGKAIVQGLRTSRLELRQRIGRLDWLRDRLGLQRLRNAAASALPRAAMLVLALVPGLAVFVLAAIDTTVL